VPFRRQRDTGSPDYGAAIWIVGATVGVAFLAAAYAKLDTSGLDWIRSGAVKYHFIEDFHHAPGTWGLEVARRPALAVALALGAILVESLFVVHVFLSHPLARVAFGVVGLSLLTGFYQLQGVFWPLWWVLFFAFIPWERLAQGLGSGARQPPAPHPVSRRAPLAVLSVIVCVQIFVSAHRVEVEPFISDYGMYSWTWTSTEAFDQHNARKQRTYRYAVEHAGEMVDVNDRLRALPYATARRSRPPSAKRSASSRLRTSRRSRIRFAGSRCCSTKRRLTGRSDGSTRKPTGFRSAPSTSSPACSSRSFRETSDDDLAG
jgi:hypothetical protein